ncbi:MAG: LAGLIDADG family homing endonuclease [Candidatus Pacebacteria bacterium]|nr:LAGLIDADG family homing endonuclease [Candidatus Paceibacterota bacterium]
MAQKRFELGTIESRIKGGKISQQRRREDPEKYRKSGCFTRKEFVTPPYSTELAEVIGIILGDGAISGYQIRISLDRHRDRKYADFIVDLMGKVLGEYPSYREREADNTIALRISGVGLVEILEKLGMQRGDKIAHQVSFPQWIRENLVYSTACVRGLFDTDGGLYFHKKKKRTYLGWCFASFSDPLLLDVMSTLQKLDFNVKKSGAHKLYMYSLESISRYFEVVGSHNPKNAVKLELRRGARVV